MHLIDKFWKRAFGFAAFLSPPVILDIASHEEDINSSGTGFPKCLKPYDIVSIRIIPLIGVLPSRRLLIGDAPMRFFLRLTQIISRERFTNASLQDTWNFPNDRVF